MSSFETRPLKDCLVKVKVPNKIPKASFLESGGYPIVSQEAGLVNGYWEEPADAVRVDRGAVVFGDHTTVLKYVPFDFVVGADGVKVLKPSKDIDPKYLYYFLLAHPVEMKGYARHYRALSQIEVRFPQAISDQRRIVAKLDRAFAEIDRAIENTERVMRETSSVFVKFLESVFSGTDARTWPQKTVSEIADHKLGKMLDRNNNSVDFQPYLRNLNVRWFAFDLDDVLEMKIEAREHERYVVQPGDLMICEGGYPGRCAIWDSDRPMYFQKAIHRVRPYDSRYTK